MNQNGYNRNRGQSGPAHNNKMEQNVRQTLHSREDNHNENDSQAYQEE
jgi:hypothetical protein